MTSKDSISPIFPGIATAISPTKRKRGDPYNLYKHEKKRQYRIKNMLAKKYHLSPNSPYQVVGIRSTKTDDSSYGFGFKAEGMDKVLFTYRCFPRADGAVTRIYDGDLLLQIDKKSFNTAGEVNAFMKSVAIGSTHTFFVKRKRTLLTAIVKYNNANPNGQYYLTDGATTVSPSESEIDTPSYKYSLSDKSTIEHKKSDLAEIRPGESLIGILHQRTRELDKKTEALKKLEYENKVLGFRMARYKSGYDIISSAVTSYHPSAPLPRYKFDKRLEKKQL